MNHFICHPSTLFQHSYYCSFERWIVIYLYVDRNSVCSMFAINIIVLLTSQKYLKLFLLHAVVFKSRERGSMGLACN